MSERIERSSELTISGACLQGGTPQPMTAPHGLTGGLSGHMRGAMLWFNPAKQHGFVRTEHGERLADKTDSANWTRRMDAVLGEMKPASAIH